VHAARPHHDQQPVVLAADDRLHRPAPRDHDPQVAFGQRELHEQLLRSDEGLEPLDPLVADRVGRLV
jgi:hypothetical protein